MSTGRKAAATARHAALRQSMVGQSFGRLVVTEHAGTDGTKSLYRCRCECGQEVVTIRDRLLRGRTTSCGCMRVKHGQTRSRIYASWNAMRSRCENPNTIGYEHYGGRGIAVCERWKSFENFLADMGPRPQGMTLDRIDNDGDYEPSNCRWASRQEQQNNRRNNRYVEFGGERLSVADWARRLGVGPHVIRKRLNKGWSKERALLTPKDERYSHVSS